MCTSRPTYRIGKRIGRATLFDLKRDLGGIVDIEFFVQFLVLAHAGEFRSRTKWSDVTRLLEVLGAEAIDFTGRRFGAVGGASGLQRRYLRSGP